MHLHMVRNPSIHSERLERWLGREQIENVSQAMRGWYGPPIGVGLTPGRVYSTADGDFIGKLNVGGMTGLFENTIDNAVRKLRRFSRRQAVTLNTGFSSLGDLISEAAAGKLYRCFQFNKVGPTGVANQSSSLWRIGPSPAVGAAPANAAAGTAFTSASVGAFPYTNPSSPDTLHFVSGFVSGTVASNTLLLYDLIFGVNKTMASVATEAVTGVPTRYQNTTGGTADSAEGNFLFVQVGGTVLAATAHNWTVCQYTDQGGATAQTLPSLTGVSAGPVDTLDHPTRQWFAPLATGDTGIKALTQMQSSASIATGVIWFMMGHPIAWMPVPIANLTCPIDAIRSTFQLARIFDNACLAFMEVIKPSTATCTYTGEFLAVAG